MRAGLRPANLLLSLDAARRIAELPRAQRVHLAGLLDDLGREALTRAQGSWDRRKAPMAAYWKVVSVYARHAARVYRRP